MPRLGLGLGTHLTRRGGGRYDPTTLNPYLYVNATNALDVLQTPVLDLDPRYPAGDIALITATNSNGTYINADGNVTAATANTVRIDQTRGEELTASRRNLFSYSEPTIAQATTFGAGLTDDATDDRGLDVNWIQFPSDVSGVIHFVQPALTTAIDGVSDYVLSCFVRMDDGGVPVVGISTVGDMSLIINGSTVAGKVGGVEDLGGGLYRVWAYSSAPPVSTNNGVVKYTTQSTRGFKVSGFQMEKVTSNAPTELIDATGSGGAVSATHGPRVPMILAEPSATNLVEYSEDYTVSNWVKDSSGTGVAPIVTSNYAPSPDGTQNASRVQFDKGSGTGYTHQSILKYSLNVSSGITTSKSVYLKSNTTESFDMILYGSSDASGTNGKKITVTPDWQRFDVYGTIPSATTGISIGLREIFVTGLSNTADVLVWGVQLEAGSVATSYIPTSGSWATRTADVYKIDGTNFSDLWDATEGTIYTEFVSRSGFDGTQRYVLGSQSSNARFCYLQGASDDTTTYDGVNLLIIPYVPGEINRYAVTFEDSVAVDAMRASLNGSAEVVDTHNGNLLSLPTQLNIGSTQAGVGQLNGHIKRVLYWPTFSDNIS